MGRYAVFIVLALTFSLMTYGQGLRNTFFSAEAVANQNFSNTQARNIAQSAAYVAIQKILDTSDNMLNPAKNATLNYPSGTNAFLDWPDMQGSYRFTVQNQNDTLIVLQSFGRFGNTTYRVDVMMSNESSDWNPDLTRAVFSDGRIDLSGSARIVGHAGSNATGISMITLAGTARVDSTLSIGPGAVGLLTVSHPVWGGPWYNELKNLSQPQTFELPDFPASPASAPRPNVIVTSWPVHPPLNPADYEGRFIPELRIESNVRLTLNIGNEDRVLHVGHLNIINGHIDIIGTGKLTIFVEDRITMGSSSTVNNNTGRNSGQMFTYYRGTHALNLAGGTRFTGGIYARVADIAITNGGGINGNIITGGTSLKITGGAYANSRVMYAPNAYVEVRNGAVVNGAIVSNRFVADGNTRVIYNRSLTDPLPQIGGSEQRLAVRSWR